jgi:hypothetical protein
MQSWGSYCFHDVPNSWQTNAAKQILEALFRANRIKHWIHGEIRHPDSTITIGSLKPLVRLLFIIQSGVNLGHTVRRNIAFARNVLQLMNGTKGFPFFSGRSSTHPDLGHVKWAISGQTGGFLQLTETFLVLPLLYIAFAEDEVGGCKVQI